MIRALVSFFAGAAILASTAAFSPAPVRSAFDATVRIQANATPDPMDLAGALAGPQVDEPTCSGFVAYSDRGFTVVVTARHCTVDDEDSGTLDATTVRFSDGDVAKVDRVIRDDKDDLAIIVAHARHNHPSVFLHEGVDRGEDLFAVGMPNGFSWSYAPATSLTGSMPVGQLNDEVPPENAGDYAIACAGCGLGSSGGPVLNAQGRVVGVLVIMMQNTSTFLMIPAGRVTRFLMTLPPLR